MRLAERLTALYAWCTRCLPGRRKPQVIRLDVVGMLGLIWSMVTTDMHQMGTPRMPSRAAAVAVGLLGVSVGWQPCCKTRFYHLSQTIRGLFFCSFLWFNGNRDVGPVI